MMKLFLLLYVLCHLSLVKAQCSYYPAYQSTSFEYSHCMPNIVCITIKVFNVDVTTSQYGAFALSLDQFPDDSEVHYCVHTPGSNPTLKLSFALVGNDPGTIMPEETIPLNVTASEIGTNFYSCSYTRAYSYPSMPGFVDISTTEVFLLSTTGPAPGGIPQYEEERFGASQNQFNLAETNCTELSNIACLSSGSTVEISRGYVQSFTSFPVIGLVLSPTKTSLPPIPGLPECGFGVNGQDPDSDVWRLNIEEKCVGKFHENADGSFTYTYFVFVAVESLATPVTPSVVPFVSPFVTPNFFPTPTFFPPPINLPPLPFPPLLEYQEMFINRNPEIFFEFNCTYASMVNLSAELLPFKPNFVFDSSSPGTFNTEFVLSSANDFSDELQSLPLDGVVHAQIRITNSPNNVIVLQIDNCWSTTSDDPTDTSDINLISDGCSESGSNTIIVRDRSQEFVEFNFPAATIFDGSLMNSEHFYFVHCQIIFCDSLIDNSCTDPLNCVTRRSARSINIPSLAGRIISSSPFLIDQHGRQKPVEEDVSEILNDYLACKEMECEHKCTIENEKTLCTCPSKFVLASDGRSCEEYEKPKEPTTDNIDVNTANNSTSDLSVSQSKEGKLMMCFSILLYICMIIMVFILGFAFCYHKRPDQQKVVRFNI